MTEKTMSTAADLSPEDSSVEATVVQRETSTGSTCCPAPEQASCCAPAAKASCCSAAPAGTCGCRSSGVAHN